MTKHRYKVGISSLRNSDKDPENCRGDLIEINDIRPSVCSFGFVSLRFRPLDDVFFLRKGDIFVCLSPLAEYTSLSSIEVIMAGPGPSS